MIKPLRKYHFIIWRVLAFVLPVLFIAAIVVRPPLPGNVTNIKDTFVAELRTLTDSTSAIQIRVTKPLALPSCLVFHTIGSREILLGKLGHQGAHTFVIPTPEQHVTLKLYDAIHEKTITSFTLTSNN